MIGSVINYSQNHPGSLLPHDRYTQATDLFTTFGIVDAVSDPRLVGESGRSTDPRHVAQELSQPLEGNLQYLSSLITLRTGLTALGPQPMNPRAWAWAAQALSLLYQQSADYARQDDNGHGSTKELDEFIQAGQNFESETAALGKDTATMNALLDQYAADAAALVGVDGAGAYSSDSTIESLHDLQARELHTLIPNLADGGATGSTLLWGPSTQQLGPPDVPIAPIIPNVGCGSSGKWSGAAPYALRWPGASSLAVKLQLADVQMCLSGDWVNTVANPDGFETGNLEYSLSISEALKAGTSQPTWKVVAWSSYVDPAEISICYTVDYDNENTRRCKNPETQAVLRFGDVAQELLYRQHLMPGASELSNVTTKVQSDLRNSYYGYMTARLASSSAGADVQDLLDKIKVVAGDKALIRATLQVIMPRALDSDDYLASLILGPTFVNDPLGPTGLNADGSILGDEAATIGDWLDGTQTAAAPETVLMTINDHNSRHVQALRAVVSSYQTKLASGAYVESLPVVSETLTTLDVAKHVVFSRVQGRMPASTSSDGIQRVLSHALYHQKLYADLGNRCSIGYDHVVHSGPCTGQEPAEFRDGISQSRADGLARQDIQTSEEALHSTVTVCLDKHQFDALVDFVFNVGPTYLASRGASEWKVLRLLNAGDLAGTTQAIAEWRFVNGRENSVLAAQRADDVQEFDRGETPC
jgi:GH24 family phage-related lysozyme (muramidase)